MATETAPAQELRAKEQESGSVNWAGESSFVDTTIVSPGDLMACCTQWREPDKTPNNVNKPQ